MAKDSNQPTKDTSNNLTEADVEQTKGSSVPGTEDMRIGKISVHQLESSRWEVDIEYIDEDGKTVTGETQEFDEFSQASSWVAAIEVDSRQDNPLKTPTVDHTENM